MSAPEIRQQTTTDQSMFVNKKIFYPWWSKKLRANLLDVESATYTDFVQLLADLHAQNIANNCYQIDTLLRDTRPLMRDKQQKVNRANVIVVKCKPRKPPANGKKYPPISAALANNNNNNNNSYGDDDLPYDDDEDDEDDDDDIGSVMNVRSVSEHSNASGVSDPRKNTPMDFMPGSIIFDDNLTQEMPEFVDRSIVDNPTFKQIPRARCETDIIEGSRSVAHFPTWIRKIDPPDNKQPRPKRGPPTKAMYDMSLSELPYTNDLLQKFYGTTDKHKLSDKFAVMFDDKRMAASADAAAEKRKADMRDKGFPADRSDIFHRTFAMLSPDPDVSNHGLYDLPSCSYEGCGLVVYAHGACIEHQVQTSGTDVCGETSTEARVEMKSIFDKEAYAKHTEKVAWKDSGMPDKPLVYHDTKKQ